MKVDLSSLAVFYMFMVASIQVILSKVLELFLIDLRIFIYCWSVWLISYLSGFFFLLFFSFLHNVELFCFSCEAMQELILTENLLSVSASYCSE